MRQNPSIVVARLSWPLIVLAGLVLGGCSSEDSTPGTSATEDQGASGSVEETTVDVNQPAVTEQHPDSGDPSRPASPSTLPHAALLADLVGDDQGRRSAAGDELAADPPAVQELVEIWRDGDPGQRRGAAFYAMGSYRGDDPQIEDQAIQSLKDPDARVRGLSLELVKRFPLSRFSPLLDQVLTMLREDAEGKNRATIARMLAQWPVERDQVEGALIQSVLDDPDAAVRTAALVSMYQIADEEPLLETLQEVIRDDQDPSLRRLAVTRLGRLGEGAAAATSLVAQCLEDEDEGVSDAAARTLTLLGPAAVPELVMALKASSKRTRRLACFALGTMAASARPAIPALEKLLQDPEEDIRELAEVAIRNILRVE